MSRLYSLKELRKECGAPNRHALLKLIKSGQLRSFQMSPGGKHLVKAEWWDEYVESALDKTRGGESELRTMARQMVDELLAS